VETYQFIWENWPDIARMTIEHIEIVCVGVGFAIVTGVPLGIAITTNERAARIVLYTASIIMTIPSVALFGLMIPLLSTIGQGIGFLPAVIALFLYSHLPIIRNTYAAISNIDPALREAARGIGMNARERLFRVEIPIAIPIMMAGVRMAVVMNVGIAAIATYIGGISESDPRQLIAGALLVSMLAIAADIGLAGIQRLLTPAGLRRPSQWKKVAARLGTRNRFNKTSRHTQTS
jgi:osmoprotectant transport system permease protein